MRPLSKKLCSEPGCFTLTDGGQRFCESHRTENHSTESKREYDRWRADDPIRKLYNSRWYGGTRLIVLKRDLYICQKCDNKSATVVDHIVPARIVVEKFGVEEFYNLDRCQSLCKPCHDRKTATEDSDFARRGNRDKQ